MSHSPDLLRFFHAEADEYLEAIEGELTRSDSEPDAGAFVAAARALRGSATMARVPRVGELAFVLERIGNELRDGGLSWSQGLLDDLRDAVEDLRALITAASSWTAADDQRASRRVTALRRHVPNEGARPTPPAPAATTAPVYIALQVAAIATDLDAFVADSSNRALLDDVVSRVRSLRGIAGVADHAPLGDVADSVETGLRSLSPDAPLTETEGELFRAAAALLRRASADLRARGRINLASGEIARFARASAAPDTRLESGPQVVPIDQLFYSDTGPHVVERGGASAPAPDARFREEGTTRAEHLRRLVADARVAVDAITRERVRRDLRVNLDRMERFAAGFDAPEAAAFFGDAGRRSDPLDVEGLNAVDAAAQILLLPGVPVAEIEQRVALLSRSRRVTPAALPAVRSGVAPSEPGAARVPLGAKVPSPNRGASGQALQALLQTGLAGLRSLEDEPLSPPARIESDDIVPIDALLYRGRSALDRAIEVRDAMRARGAADEESLKELYDLLDLARAE
jgi:HPt (histidine-containing phosphotransfer) domain-containing protein